KHPSIRAQPVITQIKAMLVRLDPFLAAGVPYFKVQYGTFTRCESCWPAHKANLRTARRLRQRCLASLPRQVLRHQMGGNLKDDNTASLCDPKELIDVPDRVFGFDMLKHEAAVNKVKALIRKDRKVMA